MFIERKINSTTQVIELWKDKTTVKVRIIGVSAA